MVIGRSFAPEGRLDLTPLAAIWGEAYFRRALWFTTWQAAALDCADAGVGAAGGVHLRPLSLSRQTRCLQALTTIPFVLPAMVVAAAFVALLGPRGWLNELLMAGFGLDRPPIRLQQTIWLILIAHAFYNTSVVIRLVGGFWGHLDRKLADAARLLGGNRLRVSGRSPCRCCCRP